MVMKRQIGLAILKVNSLPRIARAIFQEMPHTSRSEGGRMSAFDADADRAVYLDLLRERAGQYRLLIWGWC
jgi:hypothetical protein